MAPNLSPVLVVVWLWMSLLVLPEAAALLCPQVVPAEAGANRLRPLLGVLHVRPLATSVALQVTLTVLQPLHVPLLEG